MAVLRRNREKCYLALDSIVFGNKLQVTKKATLAASELEKALDLPPPVALNIANGRTFVLHIRIDDFYEGCYITRSSLLLALLGFGAARMQLSVKVSEFDGSRAVLSFTQRISTTKIVLRAEDYLEDNSESLILKLSRMAAYRISRQLHRHIYRNSVWIVLLYRLHALRETIIAWSHSLLRYIIKGEKP